VLPSLLSEYHSKDILNVYECALFSGLLLDKIYASKDESSHGARRVKAVTVFVCENVDGSKKMQLLVTGNSEKHVKSLPCTYRHNSNTWITCAMFIQFLVCLERRMAANDLKISLFSDKCALLLLQWHS
jgi:hypothetical protein